MGLSSNQTFNHMRVIVFRWKDSVLPVPSGILDQTSTVYAPFSHIFWTNNHKIDVLQDRLIALKLRNTVGEDAMVINIDISLEGSPAVQLPDLVGPGMTSQMNGLYLLVVSDDAVPNYPLMTGRSELRFTDA